MKVNNRRTKRRLVPAKGTPKCATYSMQQHRDNERLKQPLELFCYLSFADVVHNILFKIPKV